jgi:hypothetical protein
MTGARRYLEANCHEPDHDADRMLLLLRDSLGSQPARWPTVGEYREHRQPKPEYLEGRREGGRIDLPQHGVDRQIAGVRADDGTWFGVFGTALEDMLSRAEADKSAALAEADNRGWLHRTATDRKDAKMATRVKGVGRIYRFALPADEPDGDGLADVTDLPPAAPEPAPAVPETCPGCGSGLPLHAADCPDLPPIPDDPGELAEDGAEPAELTMQLAGRTVAAVLCPGCGQVGPAALAIGGFHVGCAPDPAEDGMQHCPGCAHRYGTGCGCGCCPAGGRSQENAGEIPSPENSGPEVGRPEVDEGQAAEPGRKRATAEDERAVWARAMDKIAPDASAGDVRAGLEIFHRVTRGVRWVSYPGQVGQAWFAKLAAQYPSIRPPVALQSPLVREITESGPLTRVNYVARPGRQLRPGKHYVTAYDLNGQHAAACGSAEMGDGEPQEVTAPRSIDGLTGFPGYVLIGQALRTGHPAFGTLAAGQWVAMPLVRFLTRDLGLTIPAARVVYWPKKGRRMSVYAGQYRDARAKLMKAEQTEPVRIALAALKAQVNAFIGMFHSETYSHGGWYRPDWYDMIVATAEANALRSLAKCDTAPVAKMADSAYWITDQDCYVPAGLEITDQLGKWKPDRHGAVTADLVKELRETRPSAALVRDAVIRIDAERRAT